MRHAGDCERHTGAARSRRHRRDLLLRRRRQTAGSTRSRSCRARAARSARLASAAAPRVSSAAAKFDWRRYAAQMAALYLQPFAGSAHRESAAPREVLSAGEGRHGDDPRADLRAHRAARPESRARRQFASVDRRGAPWIDRSGARRRARRASAPSPSARGCPSSSRAKTPTSSCCTSRTRWRWSRIFLRAPAGRLIVWYHSDVIRPSWRYRLFYRPFLRFALSRAVRIVVSSPALGASAPELQDFQAKCKVIPFGIEAQDPADLDATVAARRRDSARSESADRVVRRPAGRRTRASTCCSRR